MSQENQGTNSAAMENLPVKRKRGRPRKDASLIHGEKASTTPRPDVVKRNQRRKIDPTPNTDSAMVGQIVSGVLDGTFDAGYLLTVRVGDTDTVLRGVVFEPGLSVPISGANDVAPQIKMFKRNELPLPVVNPPTQVHGSTHQSERKNEQHVKHLQRNEGSLPPKVSPHVHQVHKVAPQVLPSQPQTSTVALEGVRNDSKHVPQAAPQALQKAKVNTKTSANLLDRGLPADVNQVTRVSSVATESRIEKRKPTDTLSKGNTDVPPKGDPGNTNQVPLVTPQQAAQSELMKRPASASQPSLLEHNRSVKPAELLQENEASLTEGPPEDGDALKDSKLEPKTEPSVEIFLGNETVDQVPQVQHQTAGSELKPDQPIDDALKGQAVELNHTPAAAAQQAVALQPITEPINVLQGNQTSQKCDTLRDTESELSVEIPRRYERPSSDAVEATETDAHSKPRTEQQVERLQREVIPAAPYDSEAKLSVLPKDVPKPQISTSAVPTENEDHVSKDAASPVQSQSNNTDSL